MRTVKLAATDGWVSMPADAPAVPGYWPDELAPPPYDMYVFGFRDVSRLDASQMIAQRGAAQISAPLLAFDEGSEIRVQLFNLGLSQRPDLVDGHTMHWHGFNNAIPIFDGVPEMSASVPIGKSMWYAFRPHEAGTYMYHCHFEDVEHVQMGMTGLVFVRPLLNYELDGTTITAAISASDTSVTVASTDGFPAVPFAARIDAGTVTEEHVLVTARAGSTLTITRGQDGTSAQAHASGATFLKPGADTALTGSLSTTATKVSVGSTTNFPAATPFLARIDVGTLSEEHVNVTAVAPGAATRTTGVALTATGTTVNVLSTAGFPAVPFVARIAAGIASQEHVLVTGVSGSTLTITRGYDGDVAVAHASNSTLVVDPTLTIVRGSDGTVVHAHASGARFSVPAPSGQQTRQKRDGSGKALRYIFNDENTRYDREFPLFLTENQPESHWRDAHIQITDWAQYSPGFALFNGRAYPDTIAPSTDPMEDYSGDAALNRLKYQPHSSLMVCNAGERIALRIASLGYIRHTLTIDGVPLQVVGADASQLKAPGLTPGSSVDNSYLTNSVEVAPGESRDVIFIAPDPGEYFLYDRNFSNLSNTSGNGYGGMLTKLIVRDPNASDAEPPQTIPMTVGV